MKNKLAALILALVTLVTVATVHAQKPASNKDKGSKYALLIGINDYPGWENDLRGAVADAINYQKLLTGKFGFNASNISMLTDSKATRDAILNGIAAVGKKAAPGDLVVIVYSGHGTLFPDKLSPEVDEKKMTEVNIANPDGSVYRVPKDYYDSAIVPYDVEVKSSRAWGNLILDDEFYNAFSSITSKGVNVVFISDSCHSGSLSKAEKKSGAKDVKVRFMTPEKALGVASLAEITAPAPAGQVKTSGPKLTGNYIAMTAAQDDETAMDGAGGGVLGGLFSLTLIDEINRSKGPVDYERLMKVVSAKVSKTSREVFDNNQNPQLDNRFGNTKTKVFEVPGK